MNKRVLCILVLAACLAVFIGGCAKEAMPAADASADNQIVVGFSQVGAESAWRVANTESIKAALREENGYELIYDDARQKEENQILALRTFIQQNVNYIVFSPIVETGWNPILQEAKEAGIPVIMIDRDIEAEDEGLYTSYIGSDFRKEGDKAVQWLQDLLQKQGRAGAPIRIVDIQGTIGSSAQIGRTAALAQAAKQHPNWNIFAQECGEFTKAKGYEVMGAILKKSKDINVVYCENDDEALGAIQAMEEAGLKCDANDGVIVISFDATKPALEYCLKGKIGLSVECNPLQGPYVDGIIKQLQNKEPIQREKYIDETQFDCFSITQQIIDARKY